MRNGKNLLGDLAVAWGDYDRVLAERDALRAVLQEFLALPPSWVPTIALENRARALLSDAPASPVGEK